MRFGFILIIALALAMDAFTVSICNGMRARRIRRQDGFIFGFYFGVFQFFMTVVGYFTSTRFSDAIQSYDHWIAFFLLGAIGVNMIYNTFKPADDESIVQKSPASSIRQMTMLAIATSVDALAVGISFAFFETRILRDAAVIGSVAFILSTAGYFFGSALNNIKFIEKNAERIGGVLLILIGLHILLEHLMDPAHLY